VCIRVTVGLREHKQNQVLIHFRHTSSTSRWLIFENQRGEVGADGAENHSLPGPPPSARATARACSPTRGEREALGAFV
jgi:hypothetical protein